MPPDEFRNQALALVEWIAAYLSTNEHPVLSRVQPGAIRNALPSSPPESGTPFDQIFRDFETLVLPGITHWNHPGFLGYFAISGSAPGILAEFLTAALNVQAMLWRTSPAATELEEVALSWLRQLLGLPASFEGVIYDTASIASLHALAAARETAVPNVREHGLAGRPNVLPLRIYVSDQAHSSIEKAAITLGIGQAGVRKIRTDQEFRMRVDLLRAAIEEDQKANYQPMAVVATCLLYTSPSPRDGLRSRMPSSA